MNFRKWLEDFDSFSTRYRRDAQDPFGIKQAGYEGPGTHIGRAVSALAGTLNQAAKETGAPGQLSGSIGYLPGKVLDPAKDYPNHSEYMVRFPVDKIMKDGKLVPNYEALCIEQAFLQFASENYPGDIQKGLTQARIYYNNGKRKKIWQTQGRGPNEVAFRVILFKSLDAVSNTLDPSQWGE